MTPASPLDTLIDQSRKARDNAGRALADEQRSRAQTAAQLQTLEQYRREYRQRLQDAMQRGVDATTVTDYNRFIDSLDSAIARARDALAQQGERLDASRQHWQQRQRQLASYDTLASRRAESERHRAQQRERRLADDMTQNLIARRPRTEEQIEK